MASSGGSSEYKTSKYTHLDGSTKDLCSGILEIFERDKESNRLLISSILQTQAVLIETLQQENLKFNDNPTMDELWKIMDKAKIYYSKLISIKQEMIALSEKSKMLKGKSLQLSQLQMKHHLDQESRKAAELELDKKIIAKVNIAQNN